MQEFLNMGGYGQYIWPCYLMSMVVLVGLLVASVRDARKVRRDLAVMESLEEGSARTPAAAQPQPGE